MINHLIFKVKERSRSTSSLEATDLDFSVIEVRWLRVLNVAIQLLVKG